MEGASAQPFDSSAGSGQLPHQINQPYSNPVEYDPNSSAPVVNYQQAPNPVHPGQPVYYQQQQVSFVKNLWKNWHYLA